ncbi:sulfur carrier protein ThiS [Solitalea canadensis]|uniref:Thiamine biosynthesis protein ThiS n=1 Tax=Solitalea canadensis (strain ATCC 29591 / DSM 3403 / JCM 21819 / LMG 8368 / NBRC 15130 / NCIMB 12057 / USAM 9D) TaxID=929556 RepID=H8KLI4_SOLCM|nr:sulfur carrier protein ThiS [Solitalea canadensis]AFD08871.1 thiamine biosynthesis protein ThiS [Solitalea canadensis DSM 3403]
MGNLTVFINNHPQTFDDPPASLSDLLTRLHLQEKKGIAVAINNSIILKPKWPEKFLSEGDRITIIQATQGG